MVYNICEWKKQNRHKIYRLVTQKVYLKNINNDFVFTVSSVNAT